MIQRATPERPAAIVPKSTSRLRVPPAAPTSLPVISKPTSRPSSFCTISGWADSTLSVRAGP